MPTLPRHRDDTQSQYSINEGEKYYGGGKEIKLPEWTAQEESRVMRKIDFRLIPWLIVCYTSLNIDRGNISNAAIMNAETPTHTMFYQLSITGTQFNWALSVFFFGYVLLEIPSNLLITRFNPSRWIARIMTTWGILAAAMGGVQNFTGLVAVRALVGSMEAGFSPGIAFYLTFWYKKYEVSSRWAYMFGGAGIFSAFSGLIAFGVADMDQVLGLAGWRWLFILEGTGSMLIGVLTWFILPDYPQTAKFLSEDEKRIVIGRLPPSAPSVVAKTMEFKEILDTFRDWRMYTFGLALMMHLCTTYAIAYFMPTVIKEMGFSSTTAQLLTIPPALVAAVWVFLVNWSSDRFQEKAIHGAICIVPTMVEYVILTTIQAKLTSFQRYGMLFLGSFNNGMIPLIVGLSTISTKGASRTAVRSAFTVACGNLGGAIGSFIYQSDDAPLYIRGHTINVCLLSAVLLLYLVTVWSIHREGIYVGRKANETVLEHGGIELEGDQFADIEKVMRADHQK
ncbi:MFS general substrate transporter [Gonapodya prolifera JEL478]|uniref:MFS general substrate transporter n=1 Tax=Gonapodya prolifera (strain JEL478) TaxID=1344416 RepID=A0A139AKR8_GONPJ|nr:MFS general substrate transporter [Gonapodya prolifera JEL478]|eukprot:KXS17392.1 MFS general substrate transporter [Gonapodya prolifera JEL478]